MAIYISTRSVLYSIKGELHYFRGKSYYIKREL